MITNRMWCAAPGSVDAVGKSLQGCRRLRPHHEDHQLGVRVPTTERTARVGPPSPLLLRSPQPMPLAGLFPQTVLIATSFTDLISFLSTPSAVLHLLRSLLDLLSRLLSSSPLLLSSSNQTGKIFFWEDLEEAPPAEVRFGKMQSELQLHKPGLLFLGARFVLSALLFSCTAIRPRWRQTAQEPRGQCSHNDFANVQVGGSNFELCPGALPKFTTNKGFKSNP